jgi:hypothetical protein
MSSDKLKKVAAWIRSRSPGGPRYELEDGGTIPRLTEAAEFEEMAKMVESLVLPRPSAELGEIAARLEGIAANVDRIASKVHRTEHTSWDIMLLSELGRLSLPRLASRLKSIAAPETQQQCDESKLVRCVHCGVTLAYQGSEADGYEVESCDCKDKERCDACERQTQQPAHHPELHSEICACLSATGRPPSREQLEKWRDMLGGETVQPPESVAEVVREMNALISAVEDCGSDMIDTEGLRRWVRMLSRTSVGPAEVWIPRSYEHKVFADCPQDEPIHPTLWRRVPVHGVQPKQEGGECCEKEVSEEQDWWVKQYKAVKAERDKLRAQLAESVADCDDCEHATTVAELERRLKDKTLKHAVGLEMNERLHAWLKARTAERDELRRRLVIEEQQTADARDMALRYGKQSDIYQLQLACLVSAMKAWGSEEDGIPQEAWEAYANARTALGWEFVDEPMPQPESTEQGDCPRCRNSGVVAADDGDAMDCSCGAPGDAEQDERGELPGCPDCGHDWTHTQTAEYSCACFATSSREVWLRHVAERTVCRECGKRPVFIPHADGRTIEHICKDGYVTTYTPAEWLKRNEVKDEDDSIRDVHDRPGSICSGDAAVSEVTPALERARDIMRLSEAHFADPTGENDRARTDMVGEAVKAILEHLEGLEERLRGRWKSDGPDDVVMRVSVNEKRLDALETKP